MAPKHILLALLLILHFSLAAFTTYTLTQSVILTKRQKKLNIILAWLIPFFWYLLVKAIHKRNPGSHEMPKKDDVSNNPFHESGEGAPGANIRF